MFSAPAAAFRCLRMRTLFRANCVRALAEQPSGVASQMRRIGLKALTAILLLGRRSKKHIDWTLLIAIFSTIVTLSLIALYLLQRWEDL